MDTERGKGGTPRRQKKGQADSPIKINTQNKQKPRQTTAGLDTEKPTRVLNVAGHVATRSVTSALYSGNSGVHAVTHATLPPWSAGNKGRKMETR